MKHLYKLLGLLFAFGISCFFFSRNIEEITIGQEATTSLQETTFPIMYLQTGTHTINELHGYSNDLSCKDVRESITPLDASKTITAKISEKNSRIKRLDYELQDLSNNKTLTQNTLTALDSTKNYKTARIKLDTAIDTSTEYGLKITLTTNLSKKIHFYTRIKYYDTGCSLSEKLDFAKNFHDATFNNGKTLDIKKYLEPSYTNQTNNSLANVTIASSYQLVTWDKLKPKVISTIVPTIKELNVEVASIEQSYFVSAKTASGNETYKVKEFYRIRYTTGRTYLLAFHRTLESIFDPSLSSVSRSEFKLGITNAKDLNLTTCKSKKKIAFVRNGALWYYDTESELLTKVFSYEKTQKNFLQNSFSEHSIHVIKMENDGTLSFVVYGYMNSGDYEGRVGILLYDYEPSKNRITERAYLPLDTTYQRLKQDFGEFCYVNNKNMFYFTLNNIVYAYNISAKQYTVLTKNASSGNFVTLQDAKCFVWSNATKNSKATKLTILNLENQKQKTISAPVGKNLVVLGSIDANVVYGYISPSSANSSTTKNSLLIYKLVICDCNGNILKTYCKKNIYITKASIKGNVIRLNRIKDTGTGYKKTSDDSILNQNSHQKKTLTLTSRVTDQTLTEKYIRLPEGCTMTSLPKTRDSKYVLVTENTTVHLNHINSYIMRYYVSADGEITAAYTNPATAIKTADAQMGVVIDSDSNIVWERGGSFLSKDLSGLTKTSSSVGVSSTKAAACTLLEAAQVSYPSAAELKGTTIPDILSNYLKTAVNLTDCSLEEVLYFISSGRPVIAMKSPTSPVILTAYDSSSVSWYDPATGASTKTSQKAASTLFENAGNIFYSYVYN